jgi:hypothetical protein
MYDKRRHEWIKNQLPYIAIAVPPWVIPTVIYREDAPLTDITGIALKAPLKGRF